MKLFKLFDMVFSFPFSHEYFLGNLLILLLSIPA